MADEPINKRNERVTKACQDIGYCCPYAFFTINSSKRDRNKALAKKLNLSESAIEFNKRKLKNGGFKCENEPNCQIPPENT